MIDHADRDWATRRGRGHDLARRVRRALLWMRTHRRVIERIISDGIVAGIIALMFLFVYDNLRLRSDLADAREAPVHVPYRNQWECMRVPNPHKALWLCAEPPVYR